MKNNFNIIGQPSIQHQIIEMVEHDRLPHAILLNGKLGYGGFSVAIFIAQQLFCKEKIENKACGKCNSCLKAIKLIHPDLHLTFPTFGKSTSEDMLKDFREQISENPYLDMNLWMTGLDSGNKQGNINKNECLNISKKASLKSFEGNEKVFIIWQAEYLGKEGNRLLKLIEEPPAHCHFILISESTKLILNTILSRCQIINIPPVQEKDIYELALSKTNDDELSQELSYIANGNIQTLQQLIENGSFGQAELFLEWMGVCYLGKIPKILDWTDRFAKLSRESKKQFLDYGLYFLRELLMIKAHSKSPIRLPASDLQRAAKFAKLVSVEMVFYIIELVEESIGFVERNANDKILFFSDSLKIATQMKRL